MRGEARYYEEVRVGDECVSSGVTITEATIFAYAGVSGDHSPLHVNEEFARQTEFGTRVAHGLLGLAVTDGLKTQADYRFQPGISLGWTWDFVGPIRIGDTVHVRFRVASMRETRRPSWGIVVLATELVNQRGDAVQRGEHRLMIPRRPGAVTV
jgi:acyl dehydratase